jgi:DNA topoisomerase VI subunit B
MSGAFHPLHREVFSTSRLAELTSRDELIRIIGCGPDDWPRYVVKELIDNALDDHEEHGIAPEIRVDITDASIIVADQGSGLTATVLKRICDLRNRTSSREAYVSPSRGAQGNALQTLFALSRDLDGHCGHVTVEAHKKAHNLEFTINALTREPQVKPDVTSSPVKIGTKISVHWPSRASSYLDEAKPHFLPIAAAFAALNPHLSMVVSLDGEETGFEPSDAAWRKWRPSDPTSAHWYDHEHFERLIGAYVTHRKGDRPVRDFVGEFAGLSATAKKKVILDATGLARSSLRALCLDDNLDHEAISSLLQAMQEQSKRIKPDALGVIGRPHWEAHAAAIGGDLKTFEYKKLVGEDDGRPWVVEAAFCYAPNLNRRGLVTGINFSPGLGNPFQKLRPGYFRQSLDAILSEQWARPDEPVIVFVHLAYPRAPFTDRGKANVALPSGCAQAVADAAVTVTAKWRRQKEAEQRDRNARVRRLAALAPERNRRITIKDAAAQVMSEAYRAASGGLPAKSRQIMYRARPRILEITGKTHFNDQYFTQTLLPDYVDEHPEECENWDVVWDARGHLTEPHTGRIIPLGTLEVREYLRGRPFHPGVSLGRSDRFETVGPENRYKNVLFVEKEGFDPLLARAQIADRFDIAPMSTKGMSVTAARMLLDELSRRGVENIFVLRDFDVSGFSISGTLGTDSRRYRFKNKVNVVHLGLRLVDVVALGLESEPVAIDADEWQKRVLTLRRHGATEEEIDFLRTRRVELNAMSSPDFVAFIERNLAEHGVTKLVPDNAVLEQQWRRLKAERAAGKAFEDIRKQCEAEAEAAAVPDDLAQQVRERLEKSPSLAWDDALSMLDVED